MVSKEERFRAFKSKWETLHPASAGDRMCQTVCQTVASCCDKGWDHIHVLMQTIVVTGGFLLMTLYKAVWHKYNRKIHHWEEALVVFCGSFFMIYLTYLVFNRRIVTAKIK